MGGRILDHLADLVTSRRRLVLSVLGIGAVIAAFGATQITVEPSPKSLVSGYGDQAEAGRLMLEAFGHTDHVMVILVRAEDVLAVPVLRFARALTERLEAESVVSRAVSITELELAYRRTEGAPAETVRLEDLEALDGDPLGAPELTPELLATLEALVAAEPERYPLGLGSLSENAEAVERFQLGETIDAEQAQELGEVLSVSPLIEGRLVGRPDVEGLRHLLAVAIVLDESIETHAEIATAVAAIERAAESVSQPAGVEVLLGGLPKVWVEIVGRMASDQVVLVPLTLLVCMLFLWASFRWWAATILPIVAVAITALYAVATMAAAKEPLNVLNNIVPPLLIIIGVSDSIHLIGRYREEIARGAARVEACRRTVRAMAVACFLTSLTTAVGLASLVVAETDMLRRFGVSAAIGVLIAYVVTILFLPPALLAFAAPKVDRSGGSERLEAVVEYLTRWVIRRPWTVLGASTLVFGLALVAAVRVQVDTRLRDQFDEDDPVYQTAVVMDAELDGVRPLEVLIAADPSAPELLQPDLLNELDGVLRWADAQPIVRRATGPATYLHEAWYLVTGDPETRSAPFVSNAQIDALAALVTDQAGAGPDGDTPLSTVLSDDRRTLRLELRVADVGAQATMRLIHALDAKLRAAVTSKRPDVKVYITGDAFTGSVPTDSVARDMLSSLGLAIVLIFAMLSLLFRSVRLGLLAIPSNMLPLVIAIAWMVIRGMPLNIATAIIFSISFGLAVDGTIHVLARYKEERATGKDLEAALLASSRGTGRAIAVSCAVLMFGFSVFLFSGFVPVRYFGELIAVTVGSCLLATLVVQPALLRVGVKRG